jgi:hypothetical protein
MRAAAVTIITALCLAACDGGEQAQQSEQTQPIRVRGEAQEQLHGLSDLNRAIGLKRAIRDAGYRCQRVTRSGFVAPYENLDMWMASCEDGRDWAIFVGPDGSAQVRQCEDVQASGLPRCEITSEEGAGESSEGAAETNEAGAANAT